MSVFQRGETYWYHFVFAGRHIQESAKTGSKTVAKNAEKKRRHELELAINNLSNDNRARRIETIANLAADFLDDYKLRQPKSATFVDYALRPVIRHLGDYIVAETSEKTVTDYQTARLKESASPKSINDEVIYLLRILGERGEVLRARLRKNRSLKLTVTSRPGRAFTEQERDALDLAATKSRSHRFRLALALANNTALRSKEMRTLQWSRIDLIGGALQVGDSKNDASSGRPIPLNSDALAAIREYAEWYRKRFGDLKPDWYVFAAGKPHPKDPTKPVTTLKTAWRNAKERAGVTGRLHDLRHTTISRLAENDTGSQTIMGIAGHVTQRMLAHYSHIGMEAKRAALEKLVKKP